MSPIVVTAFRWVPPFAQGLVRDLRVRWALEEAGLAYEERLIGPDDQRTPAYREMQPFGQVPVLEENGLVLFESGAIVMHIAERSTALMPAEPDGAARTRSWMLAALSTVEPPILALNALGMKAPSSEGVTGPRDQVAALVTQRLQSLSQWLEGREHLERGFSAADLLMTTVLRILRDTDRVSSMPVLCAYQQRCEARPAFQRALAAQMKAFAAHAPTT
jgi:glutathione S-transferase